MAHVHFRYENAVITIEYLAQVARERIEIADVGVGDGITLIDRSIYSRMDGAKGTTPSDNEQFTLVWTKHGLIGNDVNEPGDFSCPFVGHLLMMRRDIGYIPEIW